MAYGVDQLKSVISSKGGVARGNVYRVILPSRFGETSSTLDLLCAATNIPGRQILTYDKGIGLKREKVAYGFASEDVNMSFTLLNDYSVRRYFEAWQARVVDTSSYQIQYKDTYTADVIIQQLQTGARANSGINFGFGSFNININLNDVGSVVYECKLENAFPTTLNAIALSDDADGMMRLDIQMSYTNWSSSK